MKPSIAKEADSTLDLKDRSALETSLDPLLHALGISPEAPSQTETHNATKIQSESETPETLQQEQICRLESLPPEIRRHILAFLDLTDLKSLQQASPTFHQQYLQDQSYVLRQSLEHTLGDICLDVYATHLIMTQKIDSEGLFELYWEGYMPSYQPLLADIPNEQVCSVVSFYWNVVRPVVDHCAHWALDNLAKHTQKTPHYHEMEVTVTEKRRITRAAYRYYIYCYLAQPRYCYLHFDEEKQSVWYDEARSEWHDIHYFSENLEPWEVEEFGTFWLFARDMLNKKILEVEPRLGADDKELRRWTIDTQDWLYVGEFIDTLSEHKLVLIYKLCVVTEPDDLLHFMKQHLCRTHGDDPFDECTGFISDVYQSLHLGDHGFSEKDWDFWDNIPDPFRGDERGPPFAWTIMWEEMYSSIFGGRLGDELREWGYVFWDAARIQTDSGSGARDVLGEQWFLKYWGSPRDYFIEELKSEVSPGNFDQDDN